MTIALSFTYNSFVKFHDKKILEPQHGVLYLILYYNEVCYKGAVLYHFILLVTAILPFHIFIPTLAI